MVAMLGAIQTWHIVVLLILLLPFSIFVFLCVCGFCTRKSGSAAVKVEALLSAM